MPNRSAALALLLFIASPVFASSSRRAFTLEDLYRVKTVGEPAISPDGKTVVYSVATNDWATKKKTSSLWRVDADGKNARQLTSGDARDEHPFFSPDGKTLAFVSTRSGEPQLFFLPLAGGEARAGAALKALFQDGGFGEERFGACSENHLCPIPKAFIQYSALELRS